MGVRYTVLPRLIGFGASLQGNGLPMRRATIGAPPLLLACRHFFARSKLPVCDKALQRGEPAAIIGRLGAFTCVRGDLA